MMKDNDSAIAHWGPSVYKAIPKQVFAVVCWHFADCYSDAGIGNGQEIERFITELEAMKSNGLLPTKQVDSALRALRKEFGK